MRKAIASKPARRATAGAAALLAIALVWTVPAAIGEAPPATAAFRAVDTLRWNANGGTGSTAYVAPGGTVSFDYPSGASNHNVDFGTGPGPASCTQAAGADSGAVPPLPHDPTGPGWSGSCTFTTQQTYTFHCDLHTGMTGTIVVTDTLPANLPPGSTAPTGPIPTEPNSLAGDAVRLSRRQHGTRVRGSAAVSEQGSTLSVSVFAASPALTASTHASRLVRVGKTEKRSLEARRTVFSVKLNSRARSALRSGRKLRLTVRLALTSPAGGRVIATRRTSLTAQ